MCGRYTLKETSKISECFGIEIQKSYNIAPSDKVLVIGPQHSPIFLKWSYKTHWLKNSPGFINARSESLNTKASFRNAARCVFLSDGWFEWETINGTKVPHYFHSNGQIIYFAGVSDGCGGCAIVTTAASKNFSTIHPRQPLLLGSNNIGCWLGGSNFDDDKDQYSISHHQVGRMVNKVSNNSPKNLVKTIKDVDCILI